LESNWRFWVWESGITPWAVGTGGYVYFKIRYIAKLIVRLPPPFGAYTHVLLADYGTSTLMYGVVLGPEGEPFIGTSIDVPPNTPFPGPATVVPDSPAVAWS